MKLQIIKRYADNNIGRWVEVGEVLEVTSLRSEVLISRALAVAIPEPKPEPAHVPKKETKHKPKKVK